MNPVIRTATLADLDSLLELEQQSFTGDRLSRRRIRHWLQADNGILLVAVQDQLLLAYCLVILRRDSPSARLYSLATAPPARGRGLARRLLETAEQEVLQRGCRGLRLEVAEHNRQALSLYQSLGYREFARKSAYYEDGQSAVRMEKTLK